MFFPATVLRNLQSIMWLLLWHTATHVRRSNVFLLGALFNLPSHHPYARYTVHIRVMYNV